MPKDRLLIVATLTGTALCWWPVIIEPNLDLPFLWTPLAMVAGVSVFGTLLSSRNWVRIAAMSIVGSFVGLLSGFSILPLTDAIEGAYSPFAIAAGTLAAIPVSICASLASLVLRDVWVSNVTVRRLIWVAFICCLAFGPVSLALIPRFVASRVARNDRVAEKRFVSLKRAVEQTMAEADGPARICDGQALKQHYSGPPFSESDWRYVVGNAVKEGGYTFYVNCHETYGYSIDVQPARQKGDGTRHFCIGAGKRVDCDSE
jgi:hypothetical protein